MKSKRDRRESSTEESQESEVSIETISSSDSISNDSMGFERKQHKSKKKRKRDDSSDSESESNDEGKKPKKRKHKKKKRRHSKKKRREASPDNDSEDDSSSSDEDVSHKKKRKHKHKHRSKHDRSSPEDDKRYSEEENGRRLQSVVKERRESSEEDERPTHTYYQKEYHSSTSQDGYDERRAYEVQRFYRGSSKDNSKNSYQDHYSYERREHVRRYENHSEMRNDRYRDKNQHQEYHGPSQDYNNVQRHREYVDYSNRKEHYEDRRPPEHREYQKRGRDDEPWRKQYIPNRGYQQYNEGDNRPQRRPEPSDREYRDRRHGEQHPAQRFRNREFPDKREGFHQDPSQMDRGRDMRRGRPEGQDNRPQMRNQRSRSPQEHGREPNRRFEGRDFRGNDQFNRHRGSGDHFRPNRSEYFRSDRIPRGREDRDEGMEERNERDKEDRNDRSRENRNERGRDERLNNRPRDGRDMSRDRSFREDKGPERKSRFTDADKKEYTWGKTEVKQEPKEKGEKEKPNFGLSGKLTADANTVNGIVLKYTEPDDAKQPKRRWRFYPFKGDKALPILYIHRQSAFVLGREKRAVDILLEHPSVSKQHAALQFRATAFARADGSQGRRVRPYLIDLESANGTFVNNKKIDARRYVELMERDVVKFGFSQREYVLLHENSKDDAQDDDQNDAGEAVGANVTTTDQLKREKRVKQEIAEDGE